ncbi:hypothetical protein AF332_11385 [Sporosarcina globispora]|uniref:Uncharacterized protein n=1 Tax=Sporosarcina globispora TaxID=1459 RepID=A0A0M0GD60_SPOGL|nr:hypothetical protein [Sporosarcina globispora]KON87366.1 hypothetical protein AF332_11385 [Sporosarcina globispora]
MYKIPCKNCKGHGVLNNFKHVQDGICFKCSGSGYQEASKEEYENYKQFEEMQKQGKYIVFNNGKTELFQNEKKIFAQYGNFFTGEYGNYSVKINYKNENIIYTRHTINSDEFIRAVKNEYNNKLNKKIIKFKKQLEDELDQEWIELLNKKIKQLESQLI